MIGCSEFHCLRMNLSGFDPIERCTLLSPGFCSEFPLCTSGLRIVPVLLRSAQPRSRRWRSGVRGTPFEFRPTRPGAAHCEVADAATSDRTPSLPVRQKADNESGSIVRDQIDGWWNCPFLWTRFCRAIAGTKGLGYTVWGKGQTAF